MQSFSRIVDRSLRLTEQDDLQDTYQLALAGL